MKGNFRIAVNGCDAAANFVTPSSAWIARGKTSSLFPCSIASYTPDSESAALTGITSGYLRRVR
jgi:hypothetical protein